MIFISIKLFDLNIALNMDDIYCMQLLSSILKQVSSNYLNQTIFHAIFNQYCY